MPTNGWGRNRNGTLLPRLCARAHMLRVLLVCEAVAVILALALGQGGGGFMQCLLLLSAYVQWIGVFSAGVLCLITRYAGARLGATAMLAVCYGALLVVMLLSAEITF